MFRVDGLLTKERLADLDGTLYYELKCRTPLYVMSCHRAIKKCSSDKRPARFNHNKKYEENMMWVSASRTLCSNKHRQSGVTYAENGMKQCVFMIVNDFCQFNDLADRAHHFQLQVLVLRPEQLVRFKLGCQYNHQAHLERNGLVLVIGLIATLRHLTRDKRQLPLTNTLSLTGELSSKAWGTAHELL